MNDNRLTEAIEIVARRIVADEWDAAPSDLAIDDLELNDEDARAVVGRAYAMTHDPKPTDEEYEAAVAFLAERADDEDDGEDDD